MDKALLNVYNRFNLIFTHGQGAYIWEQNGKEYLDFVSGIAVNCLGHAHPVIANALAEQGKKLLHVSNLYYTQPQLALANKLVDVTGFDKVFFTNSGTESVELAIKIARKFGNNLSPKKTKIIYMSNSFHGRSTGALAVTGQSKYQQPFAPLIPDTLMCHFNDCDNFISKMDDNVCGVILEPIQGESGLEAATQNFMQLLYDRCQQHNALLIMDEIQTGVGRTGDMFAYSQYGVQPDIVTIAKALGGGFPIGACLTQKRANDVLVPGDHGSTYGGNPLACAVSLAVLGELVDNGVIEEVKEIGGYAHQQLLNLQAEFPVIKDIRGQGLLLGIQFQPEITARDFVSKAVENGLLLVPAGNNVVRYFPPLNVTTKEIDHSIALLKSTLTCF